MAYVSDGGAESGLVLVAVEQSPKCDINRAKGVWAYTLSARFREPPARLRCAGQLNHNSSSTINFINLSTLPVQHIEYANPPRQNCTPKSNPASKKP